MSEKERFVVGSNEIGEIIVTDTETGNVYHYGSMSNFLGLIRLMNEQQATIQFLQNEIDELKKDIDIYKYEEKKHSETARKLYEENEQLKNNIDVLEDDNETYHKSLETLNLYTKRFIPTECPNEFKDCKTNRYYWVDHEGNFKGCLELLNLLDFENEVLKADNRQLKGRLMEYEEQIKGDFE